MNILFEVCENSGFIKLLYFIYLFFEIIATLLPIILIILLIIDFSKSVISENGEAEKALSMIPKRIISAIIVFMVPFFVQLIIKILNTVNIDTGGNYQDCFKNIINGNAEEYIKGLEEKEKAEDELRLQQKINDVKNNGNNSNLSGNAPINNYADGTGTLSSGEPNPLSPLTNLYNRTKNNEFNPNNFVAMHDKNTNQSLGAWPKNADVSSLSGNLKTYLDGNLIFPISGDGSKSYTHNGIDILAKTGTPIYSPVDGQIRYSLWGKTVNKGSSETAYSVSIIPDKAISYTGVWTESGKTVTTTKTIGHIFMTHMTGIKYRCNNEEDCSQKNLKVKKGDLIGFMGVANSVPHLHMTIYDNDKGLGIITGDIQKIYNITGTKEAGK